MVRLDLDYIEHQSLWLDIKILLQTPLAVITGRGAGLGSLTSYGGDMSDTMKVGIIGCGYWGPKLAGNFHELPTTELVYVADTRTERLSHMQELYPSVHTTQDYRDVLASDVDAVIIATPVSTHHRLAMGALRSGKHVLVEKPLAASAAEATEIAETPDRAQSGSYGWSHFPA